MADFLAQHGYVVLKLAGEFSGAKSVCEFHETMDEFPEFRHAMKRHDPRVLGSFAALGNPGSLHNMYVRRLRSQAYTTAKPVLLQLARTHYPQHRFLSMGLDRMLFRVAGDKPMKETWHRDIPPQPHHQHHGLGVSRGTDSESDSDADSDADAMECAQACPSCQITFGGFINLGEHPQEFCCIPGTQVLDPCSLPHSGFAKVSVSPQEKERQACVTIPPGHMLIFFSTLLHEVRAKAFDYHLYRLFVCFMLAPHDTPDPFLAHMLSEQGLPLLPSGQRIPMYSPLHWTNHRDKLLAFSSKVVDAMVEHRRLMSCSGSKNEKGRVFRVVYQHMPSLKAAGLPLYPPYSAEEIALLTPQPLWQ
jgi:hypothetical protein